MATSIGCVRLYAPRVPREAMQADDAVRVNKVMTVAVPNTYPPEGGVDLVGTYRLNPKAAVLPARMAPLASAPCTTGVEATQTLLQDERNDLARDGLRRGLVAWSFPRPAIERERLLQDPSALDVGVLHTEGSPTCLRVPLVYGTGEADWIDDPRWSAGWGFGLFVPFHRVYEVDAVPTFELRFGRWLGPARARVELGFGGAHARSDNANLIGYAYRGAVLFDTLLLHAGYFGMGLVASYDLTAVSFQANISSYSDKGSGFRGWIHGPRAGLSFGLMPPPPPSPAFQARPDSSSATLEFFAAAVWSSDRDAATPGLFVTLNQDASF
jgi:hypothetical protein